MKIRHTPALVLVATTVFLLACTAAAQTTTQNSIKLFSATPDTKNTSDGAGTSKGTFTVNLSCGDSTLIAKLSSTSDGTGKVFVDNWIKLTNAPNADGASVNVCYGGYQNGNDPSLQPGTDCFSGPPGTGPDYTRVGGDPALLGTFIDPNTYGVGPLDISTYLTGGSNPNLQFDLIDDGTPYANSDVYLVTSCAINPQPTTIQQTVPPNETTTFNFGPFQQKIKPDPTDTTSHDITITAYPEPQGFGLGANFSGPNFPGNGASCVPYQQTSGGSADQCWLLHIECTSNDCLTSFNSLLTNSFDVTTPITNGPGFLETDTCDPLGTSCTFTSNQISEYHANQHDPIVKAPTSPPGGYSWWIVTQNTPNNPQVTINSPTATTYAQGQQVAADYSCKPNNPVTTTTTDTCSGPVASGLNIDTSTPGPHTFTVTATDALTNVPPTNGPTCHFDSTDVNNVTTDIPGCPTGNETTTKTVNYTVMGTAPVDLAILKVAPRSVRKNTNFNYGIVVWNGGANSSSGPVTVIDVVPTGLSIIGTPKGTQVTCSIVPVHGHPMLSCTSTPVTCSVSTQTVACSLPNSLLPLKLSSLNGAVIGITVKAPNAGPVSNTATVSSFDADTNHANDSSTANTTITN